MSLEVNHGRTLAIVGESGLGKTTTAAAINQLLPSNGRIDGGEVSFEGRNLVGADESWLRTVRGKLIGLVPQDPMSNLDPLVHVGDQIAEALEVHGLASGSAATRAAVELLDMVGIADPASRMHQYPHEFSGGMRQRVLIAIGLACRPKLLIADEPTSALDVTVQRRILDRLDVLTAEMGTSVVLITHDLGLAAERADEIAVMHRGVVVERGPAASILASPQDEYTQTLLRAAPSLSSRRVATALAPASTSDGAESALVEVNDLVKAFAVRGRRRRRRVDHHRRRRGVVPDPAVRRRCRSSVSPVRASRPPPTSCSAWRPRTSGTVRFDGNDVGAMGRAELFAFRLRAQPVFQNPYASLDPRYTVERSVAEPLRVHGVGTATSRRQRVDELLDQVALPRSLADRLPHELSGGQRQRVAIARVLALSPDLVVLDEAVSALDVLVQAQILELLAELQAELGLGYLFISHDLAVVRIISHEVHVMRQGRIVESGTPDDIFERPTSDYTRVLLAAIPGGPHP